MRPHALASAVVAFLFAGCNAPPAPRSNVQAVAGCSGLCSTTLSSGSYNELAYRAYVQDGAWVFDVLDASTSAVLVSSRVAGESVGSVTFAGAQPFDGSATPSNGDFDLMDRFASAHGQSLASLVLLLDWQNVVDPNDPTQVAQYAAAVQAVQTLAVYQADDATLDLQSLAVSLGTGYFNPAVQHSGALAFGYISGSSETVPMTWPLVGGYNFLGDGSPLGAGASPSPEAQPPAAAQPRAAAPIPNTWLCDGTPYRAGCRHLCGPSCNAATVSNAIRCTDGILWRDTTYTGITNVCCAQHDDGYDACSARYHCGVGNCRTIIVPIPRWPFVRTIRISCATMVEICRRIPDAACVACALLNGYQATDCLLWTFGVGPGTPISFLDTTRIGTCCPRCGARASATSSDTATASTDDAGCVCDPSDGGAPPDADPGPSPSPTPS